MASPTHPHPHTPVHPDNNDDDNNNNLFPLTQCHPSDIPAMYKVFNAAFGCQPTNSIIYPPELVDPIAKRSWFIRNYERHFAKKELCFFKITDVRRGEVVAWVKWGSPGRVGDGDGDGDGDGVMEEKEERDDVKERKGRDEREVGAGEEELEVEVGNEEDVKGRAWPKGTNLEFVKRHYGMLGGWQEKYVDEKETYVAHFLCTSPSYQRKGFATRLLRVRLDKADEEGRKTYIEASPDGYPLYLKLGFKEVERDTFSLEGWGGRKEDLGGHVCMIREPVKA